MVPNPYSSKTPRERGTSGECRLAGYSPGNTGPGGLCSGFSRAAGEIWEGDEKIFPEAFGAPQGGDHSSPPLPPSGPARSPLQFLSPHPCLAAEGVCFPDSGAMLLPEQPRALNLYTCLLERTAAVGRKHLLLRITKEGQQGQEGREVASNGKGGNMSSSPLLN